MSSLELESMLNEIFANTEVTHKLSHRLQTLCMKPYGRNPSDVNFKIYTDNDLLSQYLTDKLTELAKRPVSGISPPPFSAVHNQQLLDESMIQANSSFTVTNMECEYLTNPLGLDTATPRLTWQMQDTRQGAKQTAYRVLVGTDSTAIQAGNADMWSSGWVTSVDALVAYAGQPLKPFTQYFWRVDVGDMNNNRSNDNTRIATFETGMMQMSNWQGTWISDTQDTALRPAGYFRSTFMPSKAVKSARVYIAVAGLFELYVNDQKITDQNLNPMFTRFDLRTLYVTFDVTSQLSSGQNGIGVILGNGWYNFQPHAVWNCDQAKWRARPTFCLDLRITYTDGTIDTIKSGTDWKATSTGPIISNNIYTGEHYDARLEMPAWSTATFDDSKWQSSISANAPSKNIVAQVLHPIRQIETVPTKTLTKLSDTNYLFDLGRNIAGVTKFNVKGTAGTTIQLVHGEIITADGHVDQSNINNAYQPVDNSDPFQTDIYILDGNDNTFMPRFNYKGFQYIEIISDQPVDLTVDSLIGYFMHSDVPSVSQLSSANTIINKLWSTSRNSYLSNLYGYPTDCPQREKNGWTGDAHTNIETGLYNFDSITIYEKWLADHRDEQQPTGVLPAIIPTGGWGYDWANGLDWTSTVAVIPWTIYLFYGDSKLLKDCYANIKLYVDYIDQTYPTGLTDWGLGDWVPIKSVSSVELTSTCYYYRDATILANAANLFGNSADNQKYTALASKIKDALNAKYLNTETGIYASGYQTELSAPLFWGLVPDEMKTKVAANLANAIASNNNQMDVGLLGTKSLLNALSENGYADLAYKLASTDVFPSWGYWIVNGATTFYENWVMDPEKTKGSASRNHIMFGEINAWFFKGIGGIKPDQQSPGFKNIILAPNFVTGLDHFEAAHQGPYGTITSSWQRAGGNGVSYTIVIPANSTATFQIPSITGLQVYENGSSQPIPAGTTVLQLVAGIYQFVWK